MRKTLLTLFLFMAASTVFAQTLPKLDSVRLATPADYRAAEPIALQVSNYILTTPSDQQSIQRLNATHFLLDWMGGTPDYTFDLDKKVIKYFEKDLDLMGVYTAALTSSAIENKTVKDPKALTSLAVKKFIAYINNSSYNVALNARLKKMIEAGQNGAFN